MNLDAYIGGAEHACMHLIYSRFYTKFLKDLGLTKATEPAKVLFNQGMLHGEDGHVMSKSRGNGIDTFEMIDKYGVDTLRMYLVSVASPDKDFSWSTTGIESINKYLKKVIGYFEKINIGESSAKLQNKLNKTIRDISTDYAEFKYNLAVIKLRQLFDVIESEKAISKEDAEHFLKILSPVCPHTAEELWQTMGNKDFISTEIWPAYEEDKINEKVDAMEGIIENTISDIHAVMKLTNIEKPTKITLIAAHEWKYEFMGKLKEMLLLTSNPGEIIKEIMSTDLKKYGQEITKLIPQLANNRSRIPEVLLTKEEELIALKAQEEKLKNEFGAQITIISADDSDSPKTTG